EIEPTQRPVHRSCGAWCAIARAVGSARCQSRAKRPHGRCVSPMSGGPPPRCQNSSLEFTHAITRHPLHVHSPTRSLATLGEQYLKLRDSRAGSCSRYVRDGPKVPRPMLVRSRTLGPAGGTPPAEHSLASGRRTLG